MSLPLKILYVSYMTTTFIDRLKIKDGVEGEDYYKVSHVPSVRIGLVWSPEKKHLHLAWHMMLMKFMN